MRVGIGQKAGEREMEAYNGYKHSATWLTVPGFKQPRNKVVNKLHLNKDGHIQL